MSGAPAQRSPQPPRRPGPMGWLVGLAASLVGSLLLSLVLGCVIEWAGMHLWWPEEGVRHSEAMVSEDLSYLRDYPKSLIASDTYSFAAQFAVWADKGCAAIGLHNLVRRSLAARAAPPAQTKLGRAGHAILVDAGPYLLSAIYVAQDTAVRLAIVVLALPALALSVMVGLVDGLGRRDVRRWAGGRESSFVYHHAKRLMWPAATLGFTCYLTWPTGGFNPAWIVLPGFVAVAAVLSLMAGTFKKYL